MIYDGALRDTTNRTSSEYIEINSCNIQQSRKKAHVVIRNAGRVDYHILYIAEGECLCLYGSEEKLMKKGDFVIYPPHVRQRYSFMEGTAVMTMWVHFAGVGIEELFEELGLCGGIYQSAFSADIEHYFRKMINANAINSPKHKVLARGYLLNLLASLSSVGGQAVYSGTVAKMIEYVNLNWQKEISVAKLAEVVNLSESRAAHVFKEAVGKSIHRYISEVKITNSKALLLDTDMSVAEISRLVGYADPLYFSRAFKAIVGTSPKQYRSVSE